MVLRGNCPDCGDNKCHLTFSFRSDGGTFSNRIVVDQYDILCFECESYITVWMNLSREIYVTLPDGFTAITLPSVGRRQRLETRSYFPNNLLRIDGGHLILTTYRDAIRLYILPSITRRYGKITNYVWNNGRWKYISPWRVEEK